MPTDQIEARICELEGEIARLDTLMHDPAFWTEFMRNGFNQCVYREQCGAQRCLGLNTAYIDKFGWHEDVLVPLPMPGAETDE